MYLKSVNKLWGTNRQLHKCIMMLMAQDGQEKTPGWNPLDPIRSLVRHNPPKKIKHKNFQNFINSIKDKYIINSYTHKIHHWLTQI